MEKSYKSKENQKEFSKDNLIRSEYVERKETIPSVSNPTTTIYIVHIKIL